MPIRCIIVAFAGSIKTWVGGAGSAGYGEFVGACGRRAADREARDRPVICCYLCGSFGGDRAGRGEGGKGHEEGG